MRHHTDAVEVLPFDDINDIGNVGVQIDTGVEQMRALAQPRERGSKYFMATPFQEIRHPPPAPAAVPRAVHEKEGFGWCLGGCRRQAAGRKRGHACSNRSTAEDLSACARVRLIDHIDSSTNSGKCAL